LKPFDAARAEQVFQFVMQRAPVAATRVAP